MSGAGARGGAAANERLRAIRILKRHGWNATSFQVLERAFRYWFPDDDAFVAYVESGRSRVVAGGPVCSPSRLSEITQRFVEESRVLGCRVCFFPVEPRLIEQMPLTAVEIGRQPWWHPAEWNAVVAAKRSLREQLRRARAKGVIVDPLDSVDVSADSATRRQIESLISRWSASREMAPMAFLVDVEPFQFPEMRRYYVARLRDRIVGFAAVVPVLARDGWFLEDLIRSPDAPNGTAEVLIDAAIRDAAADGSPYFTLGLAPLADVGGVLGAIRDASRSLYNFDGVLRFKRKLGPSGEVPVFLAVPPGRGVTLACIDLLRAFAREDLTRFGIRTLFRAPSLIVRGLAVLLLVWVCVLALPPAERFFPAEWVRWCWVTFDILLAAPLYALGRRWNQGIASLLAGVIGLDLLVSLVQFATYNIRLTWRPLEWMFTLAALGAPALAMMILIGGVRRHAEVLAPPPPRERIITPA